VLAVPRDPTSPLIARGPSESTLRDSRDRRAADFLAPLGSLGRSQDDLSAKCTRASLADRLFGVGSDVQVAGARFSVRRRLGAGAMGIVYEVERAGSSGSFALKVLHRSSHEDAYCLKREFRTLSRIGHPNLVVLHELFADADGSAFSMELVRGSDFLCYVRPNGTADLQRLRRVLSQLAEGLWALHSEGVIHRDVKPSNVLVTEEGRAVLLDFGVALAGPERDVSGTVGFMAPEQRLGNTTPASDLFALGVMLRRALEGPRDGARHALELARLSELSERLTAADPGARPTPLELVREIGDAPRMHLARTPAPFVGRARELSRLMAFATPPRRAPRLAYVEGAPGFGKTALVAELAGQLARSEQPPLVLSGRCCRRETVRFRALDPLLDALSDALLHAEVRPGVALATFASGALLELFPVLARVPALNLPAAQSVQRADPRERRAAAVNALRALLAHVCRTQPVAMCIDDAHWLDEESFELIRELLRAPDAPPVLWIFATRPHDADRCRLLAQSLVPTEVCREVLGELELNEALALTRALFPGRDELWARATALRDRSPFMLSQLGSLALESASVADSGALERVIEQRIAALPSLPWQLLHVVSLSALAPSLELLGRVSGANRAELDGALNLLEAQRYIQPSAREPQRIEPYHDRIAEIVHDAISSTLRADIHRDIARALEHAPVGAELRALLFHYRQAGELDKALGLAQLEAEQAERRLCFLEAAALFGECETLTDDRQARERFARARAQALVDAGRDREAAEILHGLTRRVAEAERFALACNSAQLFFRAGHGDAALTLLAPWLTALCLRPRASRIGCVLSFLYHRALSRRTAPVADERLHHARVELCELVTRGFSRMQVLHALDFASRYRTLVRRGASEAHVAQALLFEALLHALLFPASGRAEQLLARAQPLCASGDPLLQARWSLTVAQCAGFRIDRPTASEHAQRALRLFDAHGRGVQMELGEARWLVLLTQFERGGQVANELQTLIRDALQRRDAQTEANARICLAVRLLADGEPSRARAEIAAALACRSVTSHEAIYWIGQASYARVELYEGRASDALRRLRSAVRAMAWHGYRLVPWIRIELRYLLALAALQAHGGRARRLVANIARKLAAERLPWPLLLARQLRAQLRAMAGDAQRAASELTALADAFHDADAAWYAWGSLLVAQQLAPTDAGNAALKASLRAHGTAQPERFLTSYAPLRGMEATWNKLTI
jgi:hypothetical protein